MQSKQSTKQTALISGAIFLFAFVMLFVTDQHIAITWDEPAYMTAGESYAEWFGELLQNPAYAFSPEGIETYWERNHEHPPMNKIWSGLFWQATKSFLPDLTAHRIGNIVLNSLLFAMLFLLVQDVYGWRIGLLASLFLFSMPRVFFHAHLSALDLAAATMIVAVILLFWKTRNSNSWWADIALGVLWGLAVSTKVNAVFAYFVLLIWVLAFQRRRLMARRLFVMGALAVVVFFMSWPWLYYETIERVIEYVLFITVNHWQIGQWYLNQFYMPPPWHFPFVITAVVVPITLFVLFFVGTGRVVVHQKERSFGFYLLLNMLIPMLAIAIGQSMVYDNDRLFIASMPFIAALAAIGFNAIAKFIQQQVAGQSQQLVVGLLAVAMVLPQLWTTGRLYPHLLSYYSGIVGGVAGADEMGLEATYWCETYGTVLNFINENAEAGDTIYVTPYSHDVMFYYQRQGQLRDDVRIAGPAPIPSLFDEELRTRKASYGTANFVVHQNRETIFGIRGNDSSFAKWLDRNEPDFETVRSGISLISVYQR